MAMTDSSSPNEPERSPPLNPAFASYKANQISSIGKSVRDSRMANPTMEVMLLRELNRLKSIHQADPLNYAPMRDFGNALYQYHQLKAQSDPSSREILIGALGSFVQAYRLGGKNDQVVLGWLKKIKLELGLPVTRLLDEVPSDIPVPPAMIVDPIPDQEQRTLDTDI